MSDKDTILHGLRKKGHRLTRVRRALVELLTADSSPLSALDLLGSLEEKGIRVNRTTVYRELGFLRDQRVIHEIQFGDGKMRYRICPDIHHHHVICLGCSRVEEIVAEGDLERQEREISTGLDFRVLYHTLEFFGLCSDCDLKGAGPEAPGARGGHLKGEGLRGR